MIRVEPEVEPDRRFQEVSGVNREPPNDTHLDSEEPSGDGPSVIEQLVRQWSVGLAPSDETGVCGRNVTGDKGRSEIQGR